MIHQLVLIHIDILRTIYVLLFNKNYVIFFKYVTYTRLDFEFYVNFTIGYINFKKNKIKFHVCSLRKITYKAITIESFICKNYEILK